MYIHRFSYFLLYFRIAAPRALPQTCSEHVPHTLPQSKLLGRGRQRGKRAGGGSTQQAAEIAHFNTPIMPTRGTVANIHIYIYIHTHICIHRRLGGVVGVSQPLTGKSFRFVRACDAKLCVSARRMRFRLLGLPAGLQRRVASARPLAVFWFKNCTTP